MSKQFGEFFFVITLFLFFAVVGVSVVAMGATSYRDTAAAMDENYDVRTSLLYISEKVRQWDDAIRIASGEDSDALVLTQEVDGSVYETWLFCGEGSFREVTVPQGTTVNAFNGQIIMPLKSLSFQWEEELLTIGVEGENQSSFTTKVLVEGGNS